MMFLLGPIATTLCQKLGCRATTMIGCMIAAGGCLLGSISTSIYLMDLTYGFLFGIGASMCYFPSVVILGQYFSERLSLANGITSSGSGVVYHETHHIFNCLSTGKSPMIQIFNSMYTALHFKSCYNKSCS